MGTYSHSVPTFFTGMIVLNHLRSFFVASSVHDSFDAPLNSPLKSLRAEDYRIEVISIP